MSSTSRGGKRSPADFYSTPGWAVQRFIEACPLPGGWWLEPAAGDGAIIKATKEVRADINWTAVELRKECCAQLSSLADVTIIGNALDRGLLWHNGAPRPDPPAVIITNPPFSLAEEFVRKSLSFNVSNIVMLLRLNWLESERRHDLISKHPPDVYVLPQRPHFIGPYQPKELRSKAQVDSCAYAWMVFHPWERKEGSIQVLGLTSKEERCSFASSAARGR